MTSLPQNCLVVVATVAGSLLFMAALDFVWPRQQRRSHNDLIGWQLSILGTTYAVILGFMLYAVWSSFGAAELNAGLEANALVNIYRVAEGLPEPQRTKLETLSRSYVDAVIHHDWPQMASNQVPEQSVGVNIEMWKAVMSVRAASPAEQTAVEHALSELSSLSQHRLTRLLQSTSRLPPVLWFVLVVGGVLTIISACTFGMENVPLHALQVFSFSLLIAVTLVAIADIHRPFQGLIHVNNYAFQRAGQMMQSP